MKNAVDSYVDVLVRKIYNYHTGSLKLHIWNQKKSKDLPCM